MISHHNHSCMTLLTSVGAWGRKTTSRRQNSSPNYYEHTTTLYFKHKTKVYKMLTVHCFIICNTTSLTTSALYHEYLTGTESNFMFPEHVR